MNTKKCPVCTRTLKGHLSRHMKNVHKWSAERSKTVSQTHNLRKEYVWQVEKPIRKKKTGGQKVENKRSDYHKKKWCPVPGCLAVTKKMSAHLKGGKHKMDIGPEYYELLAVARIFIPYTAAERKICRESLRRENERQAFVAQALERNSAEHDDSDVSFEIDENETTDQVHHSADNVNSTLSKFLVYLMSPDGGKRERKSSLQTVQEVRTIVSVLDGKLENLLVRLKVRDGFFRDYLDVKCKPGTSKHYMSSLLSFMDFAISESLELPCSTIEDFTAMKLRLFNWRKIYNKKIGEQKWQTEEEQLDVLITPEQIARFEHGETARQAVITFGYVSNDNDFIPSHLQYTNMHDYIIVVIALANAHRSGVAAHMTIKEFERAQIYEKSGNVLIRVMKHKTLWKHGPAVVCISIQKYSFMKVFVTKVRSKIATSLPNVFVTWNGNIMELGAVSSQIN